MLKRQGRVFFLTQIHINSVQNFMQYAYMLTWISYWVWSWIYAKNPDMYLKYTYDVIPL